MKNRIDQLFERKKKNILSVFFTAGYPEKNNSLNLIECLDEAGTDMVEVGIPFSDPSADGPMIQESSAIALRNGITLQKIFSDLELLRKKTQIPVLFMGYLNSMMQFGLENFYKKCFEVGVDGLIIPDLPISEYLIHHKRYAEYYNIHLVYLITPQTSNERIKEIDKISKGFIYLVSTNATTGTNKGIESSLDEKFKEIKDLKLQNSILMGFGIKGNKEFIKACSLVNGAIVGSSFISMLKSSTDLKSDISNFVSSVKQPINQFQL
jgi:tryptophan synthase alpha chain